MNIELDDEQRGKLSAIIQRVFGVPVREDLDVPAGCLILEGDRQIIVRRVNGKALDADEFARVVELLKSQGLTATLEPLPYPDPARHLPDLRATLDRVELPKVRAMKESLLPPREWVEALDLPEEDPTRGNRHERRRRKRGKR